MSPRKPPLWWWKVLKDMAEPPLPGYPLPGEKGRWLAIPEWGVQVRWSWTQYPRLPLINRPGPVRSILNFAIEDPGSGGQLFFKEELVECRKRNRWVLDSEERVERDYSLLQGSLECVARLKVRQAASRLGAEVSMPLREVLNG